MQSFLVTQYLKIYLSVHMNFIIITGLIELSCITLLLEQTCVFLIKYLANNSIHIHTTAPVIFSITNEVTLAAAV